MVLDDPVARRCNQCRCCGHTVFFKAGAGRFDGFFARAVAATPSLAQRMTNAEPVTPLIASADYLRLAALCRRGYILVGDAAAFIDPLFSSGVMMAMNSAAFGAFLLKPSA